MTDKIILKNCIITNNIATRSGAGAYCYDGGTIINCLIYNNHSTGVSGSGGAAHLSTGGKLINCTVVNNSSLRNIGGISRYISNSSSLVNCILWGNKLDNGTASQITDLTNTTYSALEGYTTGGANNFAINTDNSAVDGPNFLSTVLGSENWQLSDISPLIDKGNNSAIVNLMSLDLFGGVRIHNGLVDVGTFENHSISTETKLSNHKSVKTISSNGYIKLNNLNTGTNFIQIFSNTGQLLQVQNTQGSTDFKLLIANKNRVLIVLISNKNNENQTIKIIH